MLEIKIMVLIKDLNFTQSIHVRYINCNISYENKAFNKTCEQETMGKKFEQTVPDIPQQNGRLENTFVVLYN